MPQRSKYIPILFGCQKSKTKKGPKMGNLFSLKSLKINEKKDFYSISHGTKCAPATGFRPSTFALQTSKFS